VSASGRAAVAGRGRGAARERPNELVTLVTRLVVAQAGLAGAIGLSYSRRNGPWIMITLVLAVALCGLAAVVRSGSHAAWIVAVGFEAAFVVVGLFWFLTTRFLGGTLFAIITLGVLACPGVARAFDGVPGQRGQELFGARLDDLGEAADDALGGCAAG
jgi:O-antigen ligase